MFTSTFERSGDIFVPRSVGAAQYDLSPRTYERSLSEAELSELGWPDATPADVVANFAMTEQTNMAVFRETEDARASGAQHDIELSNGEHVRILVLPRRKRNTGNFAITDENYCFLDAEGQDPQQRSLLIKGGRHSYLNNPFSITENHGVVATNYHTPGQKLGIPHFDIDMAIAEALDDEYTVWDNHQDIGASARSHPHIQSGKIVTPIRQAINDTSVNKPEQQVPIQLNSDVSSYLAGALIGTVIVAESNDKAALKDALETIDNRLRDTPDSNNEARANRTLSYQDGVFRMIYHPRNAFRPDELIYRVPVVGPLVFRVSGAALEKDRVIPVPDAYPDHRSAEVFKKSGVIVPVLEEVVRYGYSSRKSILMKLGAITEFADIPDDPTLKLAA